MKCQIVFLAASLCLAASSLGQVGGFKIEKIEPNARIQTPGYNFSGDDHNLPEGRAKNWLEVEVKFSSEAELTEELTVRYFILLQKQLLVGEVTHVNIPASSELYSVIYVPPRTLERLMKGKPMTANSVENIGVQLLAKGATVAQESFKRPQNPQWFLGLPQVPNLILNKNQTPFAPLYWDRYEMIKPEGR